MLVRQTNDTDQVSLSSFLFYPFLTILSQLGLAKSVVFSSNYDILFLSSGTYSHVHYLVTDSNRGRKKKRKKECVKESARVRESVRERVRWRKRKGAGERAHLSCYKTSTVFLCI